MNRMTMVKRMLPLMAAGLLAGCVVGPDYAAPQLKFPPKWASASGKEATRPRDTAWWKAFNDPVLDGIVQSALDRNLDLEASRAALREARASYRETVGGELPQSSASSAASRSKSSSSGNVATGFQLASELSWELDLFGGSRRLQEAARYAEEAAAEDLHAARVMISADVVTNYVNARGYQARIALARRTAASQRTTLSLTQSKFEAGAASALDIANAEAQVAMTEAGVPDLKTSYALAVHRLGILSGSDPASLEGVLKRPRAIPSVPRTPSPGIPADVLASRPDVRAAERRLAGSTAGMGVARAARYPSVSLTGSISTSATRMGDLGRSSTIGWQFGPSLTVPLFNGGRLAAAEDVAEAQRDGAFVSFRQSVLDAMEEVENSLVSLSGQREKHAKLAQSLRANSAAAELTRTSYEMGASDFLDVVSAQRAQYSSEDALIVSKVALAVDFVSLNKALGGGWNPVETKAAVR